MLCRVAAPSSHRGGHAQQRDGAVPCHNPRVTDEGFGYLIGCYFHQDWMLCSADGTPDGVLETFVRDEVPETIAEVHADLVTVLATVETDAEAAAVLSRLGSNYRPAMMGESSLAWLRRIVLRLDREVPETETPRSL